MEQWVRAFLEERRVGRLATVGRKDRPHVIPVVYAFDGERLFTPIDAKPKRVGAYELQRVQNIRANPHVAIIVDEYSEDWRRLRWVLLRGRAILAETGPEQERGAALLEAKYAQYAEMPLAGRPVIVVTVEKVSQWRATEAKIPAD